jgi:1-acyl-sn-glycerol-3-phosphate acyltransferase
VIGGLHALAVATFAAVWLAGLLDLARRTDLSRGRRVGWVLAILLLPTIGAAAYLLMRPVPVERLLVGASAPPEGAAAVRGPRGPRVVKQVASKASRRLFRSVEVVRPTSVATTGPQLWCASHFGALSDPIVLLHALERPPRFLAGDFLWRIPLLRRALDAVRAIPVRRSQDGGGASNRAMFAASVDALAEADLVAIFPEGVATEGAQIAPLRTGAARIALGAVDAGVSGVAIVPVGVHYQDRAALRHRVFVDVGEPLDLDAWLAGRAGDREPAVAEGPVVHAPEGPAVHAAEGPVVHAPDAPVVHAAEGPVVHAPDAPVVHAADGPVVHAAEDRALVRALTDVLDHRLRGVAPQFADLEQAHALHAAAEIALVGDPAAPPSWGQRSELAADLGRAPAEERAALVEAVAGYREALDAAGLSDAEVEDARAVSGRRVLARLLLGLLLLPFAFLGALVHAPLALLTAAVGRLRVAPPTLATILPVVGLVGALLTWGLFAWWLSAPDVLGPPADAGWVTRTVAMVQWWLVLPAWGWAALAVGEGLASAGHALRTRRRRGRSATAAVLPAMREQRSEIVARVERVASR